MYVPSAISKYRCKKCKRKIHVDDIEAIFKEQLTSFIISKGEVERYFNGTHEIINSKKQEIENKWCRRKAEKVVDSRFIVSSNQYSQ